MANGSYTVVVDGKKFSVQVAEGDMEIKVVAPTTQEPAQVATVASAPVQQTSGGTVIPASVNGSVWKILVKVGDKVEKGQVVAILEAMKMEIDIEAAVSGIVGSLNVSPNDVVEEGQTLLTIN